MCETSSASYFDERVRSPEDQEGCNNLQIKRAQTSHSTDALLQLRFVKTLSVLGCAMTGRKLQMLSDGTDVVNSKPTFKKLNKSRIKDLGFRWCCTYPYEYEYGHRLRVLRNTRYTR